MAKEYHRPRMLHRAANLLTTKGDPVPAIAETILASDPDSDYKPLRRRRTDGGSGLGGSIRRTLKDVGTSVARRASFKRSPSTPAPTARSPPLIPEAELLPPETATFALSPVLWMKRRTSHRRAHSEVLPTRPRVDGAAAEILPDSPPPLDRRSSSHLRLRPLTRMASLPESPITEQQHQQQQEQQQEQQEQHAQQAAQVAQTASSTDATIPQLLQQGVPMLKVSAKKQKRYIFRLDPDQGQIIWESKKLRFIPIENIKELREGQDARLYREQFQLAQEYEDRWLTIVYVLDGGYKTLHLIAATREIFQMWNVTLRRLYTIRQQLMSGLGSADMRQAVWEKQFWKGADDEQDQRLDFDDVERLCRRRGPAWAAACGGRRAAGGGLGGVRRGVSAAAMS